jgi:eukaryotic-like serine/threonine-protein kinase
MALLREGQIVRDTYEVERLLGEGSFAEVYRVTHRFLGHQAMKVFKTPGLGPRELEKMLDEAIMLSGLGHPNITRVFEANTTETNRGTCGFFTMEYVPGGSLEGYARSFGHGFAPVPIVVELVRQACAGAAVAHGGNPAIIHRDITPRNILVSFDEGKPRGRLSDFGVAARASKATGTTFAHGNLGFKPPEALWNYGMDSPAGDVWGVGCTLYLVLTHEYPYPEPGGPDTLSKKRYEKLVPPSRLNMDVDLRLDRIIQTALAPDPNQRYPTAAELHDELARWQERATPDLVKVVPAEAPRGPTPAERGRELAAAAVRLARESGKPAEAVQLMEEAFAQDPALREDYEDDVNLWRRGIVL